MGRSRWGLLAALVVTSACLAADGNAPRCRGIVVDGNGAPVAGAEVEVHTSRFDYFQQRDTFDLVGRFTTQADGRFLVPPDSNVPCRYVMILARKPGLSLAWANGPNGRDWSPRLALRQPAALAGVVMDEANRPIEGAQVSAVLQPLTGDETQIDWDLSQFTWFQRKTDKDGRFRFDNIPSDCFADFAVSAKGKGPIYTWYDRPDSLLPPFRAGDASIVLSLSSPSQEAVLEGKVVEKGSGKPVAGVRIAVWNSAPVISAADGAFRIGQLSTGLFRVQILPPDPVKGGWAGPTVTAWVNAGTTRSDVKVEVVPGVLVGAVIRDANTGQPIRDADFALSESDTGPYLRAWSDANGVAVLFAAPGVYRWASARTQGYDYRCYGEGEANTRFPLSAGKPRWLEFALSREPRICGVVLNEANRPVPDAFVRCGMGGVGMWTDAEGRFELAKPEPRHGQEKSPLLARSPSRNLAALLEIQADANELTVRLGPGAVVTGQVVDANGSPVAHACLTARPTREDYWALIGPPWVLADANGSYRIPALPEGRFEVCAWAPGYGVSKVDLEIADANVPAKADDHVLELADLTVSGIVLGLDGKPAQGAFVSVGGEREERGAYTSTGEKGQFTLKGLVKGEVTIDVVTQQGFYFFDAAEVEAGDKDVKIVLKPDDPTSRPSAENF